MRADLSSVRDLRFVGREEERLSFRSLLKNPYGKERLKFIWGPGGIGKTWLALAMLDDAMQHENHKFHTPAKVIDIYSTSNRHIEGVIEAIMTLLNLPPAAFAGYKEEKDKLDKARQQEGYSQVGLEVQLSALAAAFRHDLQQVVQARPAVLAFDTFEHVQDTPVGRWILSEDGLQMPGLLCIVAGRKPNPFNPKQLPLGGLSDEQAFNFYNEYIPLLVGERSPDDKAYVARLNSRAAGNPLLLGLALFWLNDTNLSEEEWGSLGQAEFQRRIASWLSPTGMNRTGPLFRGIPSELGEPLRQTLVCMAYLNRRFNRILLERLVQARYIRGASAGELWEVLAGKKMPDFFYVKDRPEGEIQLHDKLAEILRLNVLPDAFDDMTGMRVRHFANDVVTWYDDLITNAAVDQQRAILQVERLAYVLRLDVLIDIQQLEWKDTPEAKKLAQLLPPDIGKAKELMAEYQRQRSDVLNRLIVSQITSDTVMQFPLSERYEICAALGTMALGVHDLRRTREFSQQAIEVAKQHSNPEQEIKALLGLFYGTWPESLFNALQILNQALDIAQAKVGSLYPTILYWIGITYRRMHDLDEAIRWYEKALEMARQQGDKAITPTILNDLGYALILIGEYRRASVRIDMAARLRKQNRDRLEEKVATISREVDLSSDEIVKHDLTIQKTDLEEKLHSASLELGASYNTLGELFRYTGSLDRATGYYSEALAIFDRLGSYYWQVQALHARGDAHRRLSRNLFDQERIESSQRYDKLAYEDIHSSLELCEKYGFIESLPRVYRRMGRLMHDRFFKTTDIKEEEHVLNQAMNYLNKCLQVARKQNNVLEEMEALVEIAFLGDDLARLYKQQNLDELLSQEQREIIERNHLSLLRQGIKDHEQDEQRIFHFHVFENLLKMEEAALEYETGTYNNALSLYLESFTGLAQDPGYGAERCRRHFNHLFENIRRLPTRELRKEWCERFMEKWKITPMHRGGAVTVAEAHPDLFEHFGLYLDIGFIF